MSEPAADTEREAVLTVSDAVQRPIGAGEAVAVTRFHNWDRRRRDFPSATHRQRRI